MSVWRIMMRCWRLAGWNESLIQQRFDDAILRRKDAKDQNGGSVLRLAAKGAQSGLHNQCCGILAHESAQSDQSRGAFASEGWRDPEIFGRLDAHIGAEKPHQKLRNFGAAPEGS
jgi:hypothetical protein